MSKQCIICEYNAKLYQLDLNKIDTNDDLSKFTKIEAKKEFDLVTNDYDVNIHWLKMIYIPKYEYIFAIKCVRPVPRCGRSHTNVQKVRVKKIEKHAQCRLYDIDQRVWTEIDDYMYFADKEQRGFSVDQVLYDGDNRVCILNKKGALSYFDLKDKTWNGRQTASYYNYSPYKGVFWINHNNLYGSRMLDNKLVLNMLDLNDEDSKWISGTIYVQEDLSDLSLHQAFMQ